MLSRIGSARADSWDSGRLVQIGPSSVEFAPSSAPRLAEFGPFFHSLASLASMLTNFGTRCPLLNRFRTASAKVGPLFAKVEPGACQQMAESAHIWWPHFGPPFTCLRELGNWIGRANPQFGRVGPELDRFRSHAFVCDVNVVEWCVVICVFVVYSI